MNYEKRAYAYVRVSTEEQVQNYSLDTQEREIREFCKRQGVELVEVFREEGESAKTANRPVLKALREKCKRAQKDGINHVVIFKTDRLSRDLQDFLTITKEFLSRGVSLLSPHEIYDSSAAGKMNTNILAVFAQYDNDMRSERTIAGMKEALRRGHWMWKAPLGYLKGSQSGGPSLIPDPQMAPLVSEAFKRVSNGEGKSQVLSDLNRMGFKTREGRPVSQQTFNAMLKNPLYSGRVVSEKFGIDTKGDFAAIVPEECFELVQRSMKKLGEMSAKKGDNPKFPFRRWLRCGNCDTHFTASTSRGNGGQYAYYHCWAKDCMKIKVRKEVVETLFVEFLGSQMIAPEVFRLFEEVVKDLCDQRAKSKRNLADSLKTQIFNIEARRQALLDLYIDGKGISEEMFRSRNLAFESELNALKTQQQIEEPTTLDVEKILVFARGLFSDLTGYWNQLDAHTKPRFLRTIMPSGVTYQNGLLGTTQSTWFLPKTLTFQSANNTLAPPTGFEPVPPP